MEINEKCNEIINSVNEVLEQNEIYVKSLRKSLLEMKKNKNDEESIINTFFPDIQANIEDKRSNLINQVSNIFSQNSLKIEKKFEYFIKKMQDAEIVKNHIELFISSQLNDIKKILSCYNHFMKENSRNDDVLEVFQVKFHKKRMNFEEIFENFGDIKLQTKNISTLSMTNNNSNLNSRNLISDDDCFGKSKLVNLSIPRQNSMTNSGYKSNNNVRLKNFRSSSNQDNQFKNDKSSFDNIVLTPRINNMQVIKVKDKRGAKEILDTAELLEDNENQFESIHKQFELN